MKILSKLLTIVCLILMSSSISAKECIEQIKGIMSSKLSKSYKFDELKRIKLDCNDLDEYQYFLGVSALNNKKYLEAQKALTTSLITPDLQLRQATYKQLLNLFLETNNNKMAFETAVSFVEQFPESGLARGSYSYILLLKKKFKRSIEEGAKAFSLSDDLALHFDMLKLMIISYHELGEFNNSVISFQKAAEIDKPRILESVSAIEFTAKSLIKLEYHNEARELIDFYKRKKNGKISKDLQLLDDYLSSI